MRHLIAICVIAALCSCATPPETHLFEKTETYTKPKDAVWTNLVDFFSRNNISIKTIEKDSGIIYAETTSFDPTFADCGSAPLYHPVRNVAEFNVFVRQINQQRTQVTVNTTYREMRQFGGYPPVVVDCSSTGVLERMILRSL